MLHSRPHLPAVVAAARALRCPPRRCSSKSTSTSSSTTTTNSPSWPILPTLTDPSPTSFRTTTLPSNLSIKLPRSLLQPPLPAVEKWFIPTPQGAIPNYTYLDPYASSTILPIELVTDDPEPTNNSTTTKTKPQKTFTRASAPLQIWLSWSTLALGLSHPPDHHQHQHQHQPHQHQHHHQNNNNNNNNNASASPPLPSRSTPEMYIAQSPLSHLPPALKADFPTPAFLLNPSPSPSPGPSPNPEGNIYASSLWMGVGATYTPLHRDGNPNILLQLAGRKKIRLIEPGGWSGGYGMGQEVMQGMKREKGEEVIWGGNSGEGIGIGGGKRFEVEIEEGEGVFIPRGWWHSVKGVGGGVVASVNWWFR